MKYNTYKKCMICKRLEYQGKQEHEGIKPEGDTIYTHGICKNEECIRKYVGLSGLEQTIAEQIIENNKGGNTNE